jgi:hypothetical protein
VGKAKRAHHSAAEIINGGHGAKSAFVVLRHNCRRDVGALLPQHGHRGMFLMSALINRTRMVAIEFGMWRSGRKGGSSGSITLG